MSDQKIYKLEINQDMVNNLEIMVEACLHIGSNKIDFKDGKPSVSLAEITVDIKRELAKQINSQITEPVK